MDSEGTVNLPVKGGKHFKEVSMGGFGGSMKNIAIGCADGRIGKREVHGVADENAAWSAWPGKELLMENMAESAKAVCDHFGKKIVFINVMGRMTVDCDCAGRNAAEPHDSRYRHSRLDRYSRNRSGVGGSRLSAPRESASRPRSAH